MDTLRLNDVSIQLGMFSRTIMRASENSNGLKCEININTHGITMDDIMPLFDQDIQDIEIFNSSGESIYRLTDIHAKVMHATEMLEYSHIEFNIQLFVDMTTPEEETQEQEEVTENDEDLPEQL